jgi:hypothetical protein
MLFILDVVIAALASYAAYKTFQAWRGLSSDASPSIPRHGSPSRLARAGGRGGNLNWLTGAEPARFIRRREAFFRLVIQL